ncbi:uncharacterized protein si:ch211-67e16.4 isoform X2 [Antennarius striatus]|uniref:uncharacterized protein si:ch211-67e16.4 isoform X2 n=1 Tax=Antennarius striatus TaxID=241820 RepID=UPI0035B39785
MDVSIAVSLIRGQMGAVVERAVNGAVEMVLAEMLKVVGVKFEELKAQVALMKRDVAVLQREKALKEKENDSIRSKLRYTELKLKYYRQGVEEELQQRASASSLVLVDPANFHQAQRGDLGVSPPDNLPSCPTQARTSDATLMRSSQDCDAAQSKDDIQGGDGCEWTIPLQPQTEGVDAVGVPPPVQVLSVDLGQQQFTGSLCPEDSPQADNSTPPISAPQVKHEAEEVICIKDEPEDEQEVMSALLLDCQVEQGPVLESEAQGSVTEWSGFPGSQRHHTTTLSSAGAYVMPQPSSSFLSMVAMPPSITPRQTVRPWNKDISLYEEYKMRRNELRRRRHRELEKTMPQPLLADMVRERREKTRLRVARWRAKRKLQACLNQAQALGGAAGLSQTGFPITSQHQPPLMPCAAAPGNQQR